MYPQILGVYSKKKTEEVGTGTTTSTYNQETFWYVRRIGEEEFEIQPLTTNHLPSGIRTVMGTGEFLKGYTPEPRYYETYTLPVMKSLSKKIELGEQFFKEGLLSKAEREFLKATMIDEENPEANLGLGAVYSEQKKFSKVKKVLKILMNSDRAFQQELRTQFNTFGISLRKQGLHEEAVKFYTKALEFDAEDENLLFNLARAHFENEDELACLESLETAIKLNPDFEVAQKFFDYVSKRT